MTSEKILKKEISNKKAKLISCQQNIQNTENTLKGFREKEQKCIMEKLQLEDDLITLEQKH